MTESLIDKDTNLLKDNFRDHGHHYRGCFETGSNVKNLTNDCFNLFF